MRRLGAKLRRFVSDEAGATAIEYGMIAALVAVGAIGAMTAFGGSLSGMFNNVADTTSEAFNRSVN
jgi:pilus assembly protein Flp/PilA